MTDLSFVNESSAPEKYVKADDQGESKDERPAKT